MNGDFSLASAARWHVRWFAKGRRIEKDFGNDFGEALRVYVLARKAEKKGATLICKNVGFSPPAHLQDHTVFKKGRNSKGKIVKVERSVQPMHDLNRKGIWWCPYCIQLRRFVRKNSLKVGRINVPEPSWVCPVCGITHRDFHVRRWNPLAARLMANPDRRARRAGSRRTRRLQRTGYTD